MPAQPHTSANDSGKKNGEKNFFSQNMPPAMSENWRLHSPKMQDWLGARVFARQRSIVSTSENPANADAGLARMFHALLSSMTSVCGESRALVSWDCTSGLSPHILRFLPAPRSWEDE